MPRFPLFLSLYVKKNSSEKGLLYDALWLLLGNLRPCQYLFSASDEWQRV